MRSCIKMKILVQLFEFPLLKRDCVKSLLLLIRGICREKLSPPICHCTQRALTQEQSDVAISNFIDQKVSFVYYKSNQHFRSPRHCIPRDDRLRGFVFY